MKALALLESPDHVSGRYRVSAFERAWMARGGVLDVDGLSSGWMARVGQLRRASRYDVVILQRKLLPSWQMGILRRSARRLIFDYDDAVFYRDSNDPRGHHCPRRLSRFTRTAKAADLLIAGNDFLADSAVRFGADPAKVRVIPTCVDAGRYPAREHRESDGIKLVWVGSSSTLRGLERQRPMLEQLGREIPGLSLRVIADRFPHFDSLPVEEIPWTEAGEAAAIAGADIGITWIPDDLWSRGKCGLKLIQYMAAGLPVVANPVGVHATIIEPDRTGFLAESAPAWVATIRRLAEGAELRKRIGSAAREAVEARFSVDSCSASFVAAVEGSPPASSPHTRIWLPDRQEGGIVTKSGETTIQASPSSRHEPVFKAPGWDWEQAGEVGWWVRPEWHQALIGPDGLKIDQWRTQGRLSTVKTGPHRVVYRADLPEGTVFVKHFLVPGWREMLRQWLRRGKGRNEGRRALRLAGTGVPTITPIALGEQRKRKFLLENYLITPAVPDTAPLNEFVEETLPKLDPRRQAKVRQILAESLAELTAKLHEAGFVHQDFHPGNILVRMEAGDVPRLTMIDLDALRSRPDLKWKDAQENLALLNHYFWLRCGRSDRMRFLKAYLENRRSVPPDPAEFARGIEEDTRSWAEKLWRRWGRRCARNNKYFKKYKDENCWSVASRDVGRGMVRDLMANPDAPFRWPGAILLKDSRTTTVAEVEMPVLGVPTRVIYKRFNRKKFLDPLYTLFRPSRAWRAWQNGQHLASRAVPTPKNLVVIGRASKRPRIFPHQHWSHDTYLVTLKAEPSITLGDYALTVLPTLPPEEQRRQIRRLSAALSRLIRTMHERSLSHRDLKAANILIEGPPDAESPKLTLIDLVGVHLKHPLGRRRRVQNLARLQISLAGVPGRTRTDSLRFLRAYLPWVHTSKGEWKGYWREIARASREKAAQNLRRGRALS